MQPFPRESQSLSLWKKIQIFSIVVQLFFKVRIMDTDKVTTVASFIKAGCAILALVGISISPEHVQAISVAAASVWSVAEIIHGWFTNKA